MHYRLDNLLKLTLLLTPPLLLGSCSDDFVRDLNPRPDGRDPIVLSCTIDQQ